MFQFEDNEFEIIVCTYKRADFIRIFLDNTYQQAKLRNIQITILDSSPSDETEQVVKLFNDSNNAEVGFIHASSETIIGYKPIIGIQNSNSKYVWIAGDSRYFDFEELDAKVFPLVKQGIEWITFLNKESSDTIYSNKTEILHELFIPATCIGCSIYKNEIFRCFKENKLLMKKVDTLFKQNFGFAWLGYFFTAFSFSDKYKAAYVNLCEKTIGKKKVQSWAVRFYGCWVDDLLEIVENLPECYKNSSAVLEETWQRMKLDSVGYCFRAKKGDLNKANLKKYSEAGIIKRITRHPLRLKFFAYAPFWLVFSFVKMTYFLTIPLKIIRKIHSEFLK